MSDNLKEE